MIGSKSRTPGQHCGRKPGKRPIIGHILLADSDLASRLTLSTLLTAGGYAVDSAASTAEAIDRIDQYEYQLVLADLRAESADAGQRILAYARQKCYHPATALVTSSLGSDAKAESQQEHRIAVENEDVSNMLDRVAELIGMRVSRRVNRRMAKAL